MNRWSITLFTFFLTLNGWSYHFDREPNWNEQNNITGFEYQYSESQSVECATFINSFYDQSTACGFDFSTGNISIKVGLVSGYRDRVLFYALPTLKYKYELLKLDLIVVPSAVILMFKIKFK